MNLEQILAAFPRTSALVAGDICLDRWCTYSPAEAEPSRETGIPRIAVVSTEITPGAGGTVANNLAALGCGTVAVLGAAGDDGFGYELRSALESRGIRTDLLVRSNDIPTFTYTKLLNAESGEEDRPRVDFIRTRAMPESVEKRVLAMLEEHAASFDVVLVSDQAETAEGGVITPRVREWIGRFAGRNTDKVVWVDSRLRPHLFRSAIVKPNAAEAHAACVSAGVRDYIALRTHLDAPVLFVTEGPLGVRVIDDNGERLVPTCRVEHPVDICGAGDSFSAGCAVAYAATRHEEDAARFGNLVASITIMKKGTGTATPGELRQAALMQARTGA